MSCSSCGTNTGGKPNGCKSNGGCSTGGCNRMNVHDWLTNLPLSDEDSMCHIIEVSFNNGSRKEFYRNSTVHLYDKGDMVTVEGVSGFDTGEVSLSGELVRLQLKKKGVEEHNPEIKRILRRAGDRDLELWKQNKAREPQALMRARSIARQLKLEMKLSEVEFQADGRKATFFYTADGRIDFRELIKIYASEFKVKVEMKQIGARQEAAKVGGIGSCGRELCCSTWLTSFKSVTTIAARYQNLSINQTKLSGQCGRLKCCLNYELDTYLDALQGFPDNADMLETTKGNALLIKKDIFRNLMWYILPDSNKHYPLSIATVRKIKEMNVKGIKPEALETEELVSSKPKEVEPDFVDVVGQISLRSLEKNDKRRKFKQREQQERNRSNTRQQAPRPPQQNQPRPTIRKDKDRGKSN
ncbi:regulatory iron-sulfur-containing complex subunit RicT [Agriterribacter sp.]|uniref:PSP1 domain-containing protein n=1 Tax=Agriterribacter sp. TaxID=2821509 RepID=UPI002BF014F4|nr:regulatory iron-sulfur-containing complex subunit RicT [Agriterribacter sp.]HRO45410.1 regulatory iron-sulfur-containing complex subunit RicT [Agriterribacter sp.]HRQ16899.1 regulatory iron-sulfur-containing complex subunit RicT [Agriterribacter sp.]